MHMLIHLLSLLTLVMIIVHTFGDTVHSEDIANWRSEHRDFRDCDVFDVHNILNDINFVTYLFVCTAISIAFVVGFWFVII